MNPPATVNWKFSKTGAFVVLILACLGLEIPAQAGSAQPNMSVKSASLADGTYLYGETPQPNQVRNGYMVFQRQHRKVVGAFYYPSSEFKCFTGFLTNNTINVNSAESGKTKIGDVKIKLSDLHQIQPVSANDQRILSVCKQETVALAN